jgi:putative transposase
MPSVLRFRLYPSHKQERKMIHVSESCRHLWNDALSHRQERWQHEGKATSYNLQQALLTRVRHLDPEIGALHSQVAQDVLHRLDKAFRRFFRHQSKYPRFKKSSNSGSFTYAQGYNGSVKPDSLRKRLFLSKIGNVKVIFHRPLPKYSRLKTCTVIREPDGKWFASLVFEEVVPLGDPAPAPRLTSARSPIGVDLGLLSLVTTSNGEQVEHPGFLRKADKRLKHLQHALSHKKKGSKNRNKARQRVASQHSKVKHQRLDFNHKLSTKLVRAHDFIAFEDLRIKNMVKNHKLARSIQDASWGQLVRLTEYKALKAGSRVIKVPAAYSTQECFHCGVRNKIDVDVREFVCIGCCRTLQRDPNAARIVLKRGLAIAGLTTTMVGQDMPELKPVETRPLPLQRTGEASNVEEAGTMPTRAGSHGLQPWKDVTSAPCRSP